MILCCYDAVLLSEIIRLESILKLFEEQETEKGLLKASFQGWTGYPAFFDILNPVGYQNYFPVFRQIWILTRAG